MTWQRVFENPLYYSDARDAWCDTRTGRCGPNAPAGRENPRQEIYVVDFADRENRPFMEGRSQSFLAWIERASLTSARKTIEAFSGDNTNFVIVEIDRDRGEFRIHTSDGAVIHRDFEDVR